MNFAGGTEGTTGSQHKAHQARIKLVLEPVQVQTAP